MPRSRKCIGKSVEHTAGPDAIRKEKISLPEIEFRCTFRPATVMTELRRKEWIPESFSLRNFLHPPASSFLLNQNILSEATRFTACVN